MIFSQNEEACSSVSEDIVLVGITDIGELFSDAASQSVSDLKSSKNDEVKILVKYPPHLYKE